MKKIIVKIIISKISSIMNRSVNIKLTAIIVLYTFFFYSCNSEKKNVNQKSDNLKIISYNVWYGFTIVPERKKAWIAWMNDQQPDIVSLQELNEYTNQKLAEDAKSYGHAYSVLLKVDGFPTGITSRYPIEDIESKKDSIMAY